MTFSSKDIISRILTTYLRLTCRGEQPKIKKISEEALAGEEIVVKTLREYGIGGEASSSERVRVASALIMMGVEGDRIARYLHWREFEELSAELLKEAGYTVYLDTRVRIDKKKYQIDLTAYSTGLLLVVDCKHWAKPPAYAQRRRIISMLEQRIKALAKLEGEVQVRITPIVLTLYEPRELIVEGYLYVPLRRITGFIEWFQNNYPHIRCIKTNVSLEKLKESSRRIISKSRFNDV